MNLGFYVKTQGAEGINGKIYHALNKGIEGGDLDDASVFYDNIEHNSTQMKFGMFNSTDIWFFTGELISTSLETTYHALKATNKFNLSYLYNKDEVDVLRLAGIANSVNVISDTEESGDYFYRVTGVKPKILKDFSVKGFSEVLKDE